ncbi:hypothetical protein G6F61_014471 [Rhizopus arrhizus]|nr:hypothetical protein G6F61_014471 [Rhizopus arrhizus]
MFMSSAVFFDAVRSRIFSQYNDSRSRGSEAASTSRTLMSRLRPGSSWNSGGVTKKGKRSAWGESLPWPVSIHDWIIEATSPWFQMRCTTIRSLP